LDLDVDVHVHVIQVCLAHWTSSLQAVLPKISLACATGLEIGDFEYAGHSAYHYIKYSIFSDGMPLNHIVECMDKFMTALAKRRQHFAAFYLSVWMRVVQRLLLIAEDTFSFMGNVKTDDEMYSDIAATGNKQCVYAWHAAHGWYHWYVREYDEAIRHCVTAHQFQGAATGYYSRLVTVFVEMLAVLNRIKLPSLTRSKFDLTDMLSPSSSASVCASDLTPSVPLTDGEMREVDKSLARFDELEKEMRGYASCNVSAFLPLLQFVTAEKAKVLILAKKQYHLAIPASRTYTVFCETMTRNNQPNYASIGYEYHAYFQLSIGNIEFAHVLLMKCYAGMVEFGCTKKLEQLEQQFPELNFVNEFHRYSTPITPELHAFKQQNYINAKALAHSFLNPTAATASTGNTTSGSQSTSLALVSPSLQHPTGAFANEFNNMQMNMQTLSPTLKTRKISGGASGANAESNATPADSNSTSLTAARSLALRKISSSGVLGSNTLALPDASTSTGSGSGSSSALQFHSPLPMTRNVANVDFSTVMKAAQTFSVETDIDKLLSKLMMIVLQHANGKYTICFCVI